MVGAFAYHPFVLGIVEDAGQVTSEVTPRIAATTAALDQTLAAALV
jgi:hypothetical protein